MLGLRMTVAGKSVWSMEWDERKKRSRRTVLALTTDPRSKGVARAPSQNPIDDPIIDTAIVADLVCPGDHDIRDVVARSQPVAPTA